MLQKQFFIYSIYVSFANVCTSYISTRKTVQSMRRSSVYEAAAFDWSPRTVVPPDVDCDVVAAITNLQFCWCSTSAVIASIEG